MIAVMVGRTVSDLRAPLGVSHTRNGTTSTVSLRTWLDKMTHRPTTRNGVWL